MVIVTAVRTFSFCNLYSKLLLRALLSSLAFHGDGAWWEYKVFFSKYLACLWRQVPSLDKSTFPPLSGCFHPCTHPWGCLCRWLGCHRWRREAAATHRLPRKQTHWITIKFSFVGICCIKLYVLYSYISKDLTALYQNSLRRVLHTAVFIWNREMLSVGVLQGQTSPKAWLDLCFL